MIDLLDFGLDFLAAPISWVILDRLEANGQAFKINIEWITGRVSIL